MSHQTRPQAVGLAETRFGARLAITAELGSPETGLAGTKPGPPGSWLAQAQGKAATAHDGGRNWNWGEKILCPTTEGFSRKFQVAVSGSNKF